MATTEQTKLINTKQHGLVKARVLFRDEFTGTSVSVADGVLYQDGHEMNAEDYRYWAARFFEIKCDEWHCR